MKLYTEKQVRKAMSALNDVKYMYHSSDEIFDELSPIELPSDEEIEKEAKEWWAPSPFREGAKYVLRQIKQQDK